MSAPIPGMKGEEDPPTSSSLTMHVDLLMTGILPVAGYVLFLMIVGAVVYHFNAIVYDYVQSSGVNYVIPQVGTTSAGQLETAAFFIGSTVVMTFFLAWMLGRSRKRLPQAIACLMGVSVYSIISNGIFYFVPGLIIDAVALASFILYLAVAWGKAWAKPALAIPFITLLTVGLSMTILVYFPVWTPLIIPAGLAAWDIYAVFHGPLKKIIGDPNDERRKRLLNLLVAKVGNTSIGLGDLVVYTLLVAFALARFQPFVAQAVGAVILFGLGMTIWLLRTNRLRAIPALPIPVALAMIPMVAALVI